ncbi:MAG: patatin-like phospholipase family protein [Alphaproteobacteria bacterium]|nr:patatin-like phospholipase family protein [Alphaproteobacteria bacterium]
MSEPFIALFNYGGGIRGLVPARIMARIEEVTGLPMTDMVDLFAGPSTGSILNAALNRPDPHKPGRPLYKARHLVRFYEQEGHKIFPPDRFREFRGIVHDFNNRTLKLNQLKSLFRHGHYDPTNLAHALRSLYGDTKLSQSLSSLIIPTYNIDGEQLAVVQEKGEGEDAPVHTRNNVTDEGGHALWMKHIRHDHPHGAGRQTPDVRLFDAVMASTSAPTYFPCHHFKIRDHHSLRRREVTGIDGVIFDNPCISYHGAIRPHVPPDRELVMICLGTGYTNRSVKKEDWNRFGALGIVDPMNDMPLVNIFFHASESALMDAFSEELGENLFFFNKTLLPRHTHGGMPSIQIDDASPDNLRRLARFAEELLEENKNAFDGLCHLLVKGRDRREKTKKQKAPRYFVRLFDRRKKTGKAG